MSTIDDILYAPIENLSDDANPADDVIVANAVVVAEQDAIDGVLQTWRDDLTWQRFLSCLALT